MNAMLIAHELLCLAMFYSAFCRAVWTDGMTRIEMRIVILISGSVACLGMTAPITWGYQPDWFAMALMSATVFIQTLMSRHWINGVPHHLRKS